MSMLNSITTGVSSSGIRMVIAGQEKMGKTTLACNAPNTLLLPMEVGYAGVNVAKVPILNKYEDVLQLVTEIITYAQSGQFPYKTLVFDSVTALERLIHEYVLRLDVSSKGGKNKSVTMESAHGGYGKAYTMANSLFEEFLQQLDVLAVYGGINIVLTAHVFSAKISDPTVGEYDSWELLLHSPKNQKTYGKREIFTQWADVIGFLYEPLYLIENTTTNSSRGISQNKGRVLAVSRTPAYLAGNRFGLIGELPIPAPPTNGWNAFAQALHAVSGIDVYTR
jgi:hypothetical protein